MTAHAATTIPALSIERADLAAPILLVTGRDTLAIRAGTVVRIAGDVHSFEADTPVALTAPVPGADYGVHLDGGAPAAVPLAAAEPVPTGFFAGFHFAPSGNATAREGGDGVPAINALSCWDAGFRPACPDPRGMTLVALPGRAPVWVDIYLLGVDHVANGTSRCGATIADGRDLPQALPGGRNKVERLDYETAAAIFAHHGKQLLGAEEFFAAAYGVAERCSLDEEPSTTGELNGDARRFVSASGLIGATGTMWQWGTDGHPDDPRPSIFGGSWLDGSNAGSRYAYLGYWPGISSGNLSARGRCGHLSPDLARAKARA